MRAVVRLSISRQVSEASDAHDRQLLPSSPSAATGPAPWPTSHSGLSSSRACFAQAGQRLRRSGVDLSASRPPAGAGSRAARRRTVTAVPARTRGCTAAAPAAASGGGSARPRAGLAMALSMSVRSASTLLCAIIHWSAVVHEGRRSCWVTGPVRNDKGPQSMRSRVTPATVV